MKTYAITLLAMLVWTGSAQAFEGRVFGLSLQPKATEMNNDLSTQNLKQVKDLLGYGGEIAIETVPRIHFGLRAEVYHMHVGDGSSTTFAADPNFTEFDSISGQLLMRWAVADGAPFRIDLFGGAGYGQATLKTKLNGVEIKQGSGDFTYAPVESAGVTLSIGTKNLMLVIDGGYRWSTFNHLYHDAGASPVINTIDLSGPFVSVGFLGHNGLPSMGKGK